MRGTIHGLRSLRGKLFKRLCDIEYEIFLQREWLEGRPLRGEAILNDGFSSSIRAEIEAEIADLKRKAADLNAQIAEVEARMAAPTHGTTYAPTVT
jgi:hypothetical protein